MHSCSYLGATFEVWRNRDSWFWRVSDARRNGGTIGAAATEADAVRDACLSIEESGCAPACADLVYSSVIEWERRLGSLARYVACESGTAT
jgi:hypothetical protein